MASSEQEVIFEGNLYKLCGSKSKKKTFKVTGTSWKKRYFILIRRHQQVFLYYYEKRPKTLSEVTKGKFCLSPSYTILKKNRFKNQPYACELVLPTKVLWLAAATEVERDCFVFHVQTQTRLQDGLEDECFSVRPESSEDHRKIGSKNSMCYLHISQWGVTLALQVSKSVVSQWPLTVIRSYESTGKNKFSIEAGRRAPMGEGRYVFSTRPGQDEMVYQMIDKCVMKAAGIMEESYDTPADFIEHQITEEYDHLHSMTVLQDSGSFNRQMQRISRDNYDHLLRATGVSVTPQMVHPDLGERRESNTSSSPSLDRSASSSAFQEIDTKPRKEDTFKKKNSQEDVHMNDIHQEYLSFRDSNRGTSFMSNQGASPPLDMMTPPPDFYEATKYNSYFPSDDNLAFVNETFKRDSELSDTSRTLEGRGAVGGTAGASTSPRTDQYNKSQLKRRNRLASRSSEDLTQHRKSLYHPDGDYHHVFDDQPVYLLRQHSNMGSSEPEAYYNAEYAYKSSTPQPVPAGRPGLYQSQSNPNLIDLSSPVYSPPTWQAIKPTNQMPFYNSGSQNSHKGFSSFTAPRKNSPKPPVRDVSLSPQSRSYRKNISDNTQPETGNAATAIPSSAGDFRPLDDFSSIRRVKGRHNNPMLGRRLPSLPPQNIEETIC